MTREFGKNSSPTPVSAQDPDTSWEARLGVVLLMGWSSPTSGAEACPEPHLLSPRLFSAREGAISRRLPSIRADRPRQAWAALPRRGARAEPRAHIQAKMVSGPDRRAVRPGASLARGPQQDLTATLRLGSQPPGQRQESPAPSRHRRAAKEGPSPVSISQPTQ